MTPDTPSIEQRVRRGVQALDLFFGSDRDWRAELDLDALNIADPRRCVMGQLFGLAAAAGYELITGVYHQTDRESWRFGLIWGPDELSGDAVYELNEEWRRQVSTPDWLTPFTHCDNVTPAHG